MKYENKQGYSVTVIQDSLSTNDHRLVTLQCEYPRFIHAEVLRHRQISHCVASSRAIPTSRLLDQLHKHPAVPVYWGANKSGMQAVSEVGDKLFAETLWQDAQFNATVSAEKMSNFKLHKQLVNRIIEPFQLIRDVMTATDWHNMLHLRLHADAQPEFRSLAQLIMRALRDSVPTVLMPGEYHVPFVHRKRNELHNKMEYYLQDDGGGIGDKITLEDAIDVSMSCVAQTSYRKQDTSLKKARTIVDKLFNSGPVHASPAEHIATPMGANEYTLRKALRNRLADYLISQEQENSSSRSASIMYSGNLRGWTQYRKLIKNETVEYSHE